MKPVRSAMLAVLFLVAACGGNEGPAATDTIDASEALSALFDEHFERNLELNPVSATFIGDDRYNDRMANFFSADYLAASDALDKEFLQRLLEIDRDQLDYQEQLSYDIFRINRELAIEGRQFPFELIPVNQFWSVTNFFAQLGSGAGAHPFKTVKDYEDFLSRADDFAAMADTIVARMREGVQRGVVQPRILMEKLLPQIDAHVVDSVEDSLFYTPVTDMPANFSD